MVNMSLFLSHFSTGNHSATGKLLWPDHAVDRFVHRSRAAPVVAPLLNHGYPNVFKIQGDRMKAQSRKSKNPSFEDIPRSGTCVARVSMVETGPRDGLGVR
jgi:hypothetical protein